MYDEVYKCIYECGVAHKLDQTSYEFAGELNTRYELTNPEMCFVVDEVGCNISQRGDLHMARRKYCCEVGGISQNKSS